MLRLVYNPTAFASNVDDASKDIAGALKTAAAASGAGGSGGGNAYNIAARQSVRSHYDPEIEDVQEELDALCGTAFKLNGNFEANAAQLAKPGSKAREDWDRSIGNATLDYFKGLVYCMKRAGFDGDEMLQEGLQEGVEKKEVCVRVVEKLKGGSGYNEVVIEDGVLYIQTTPEYWWSNTDAPAEKLLDML